MWIQLLFTSSSHVPPTLTQLNDSSCGWGQSLARRGNGVRDGAGLCRAGTGIWAGAFTAARARAVEGAFGGQCAGHWGWLGAEAATRFQPSTAALHSIPKAAAFYRERKQSHCLQCWHSAAPGTSLVPCKWDCKSFAGRGHLMVNTFQIAHHQMSFLNASHPKKDSGANDDALCNISAKKMLQTRHGSL